MCFKFSIFLQREKRKWHDQGCALIYYLVTSIYVISWLIYLSLSILIELSWPLKRKKKKKKKNLVPEYMTSTGFGLYFRTCTCQKSITTEFLSRMFSIIYSLSHIIQKTLEVDLLITCWTTHLKRLSFRKTSQSLYCAHEDRKNKCFIIAQWTVSSKWYHDMSKTCVTGVKKTLSFVLTDHRQKHIIQQKSDEYD